MCKQRIVAVYQWYSGLGRPYVAFQRQGGYVRYYYNATPASMKRALKACWRQSGYFDVDYSTNGFGYQWHSKY